MAVEGSKRIRGPLPVSAGAGSGLVPFTAQKSTTTGMMRLGSDLLCSIYRWLDGEDRTSVARACKRTRTLFPQFQTVLFVGPNGLPLAPGRTFDKVEMVVLRGSPDYMQLAAISKQMETHLASGKLKTVHFDYPCEVYPSSCLELVRSLVDLKLPVTLASPSPPPSLERLQFRSPPAGPESFMCDPHVVKELRDCTQLKEFTVHSENPRHYPPMHVWKALSNFQRLEKLSVSSSIPDKMLCAIPDQHPALREFNLTNKLFAAGFCSEDSIVKFLGLMKDRLEKFGIPFLTPKIVEALGACSKLEVLCMHSDITIGNRLDEVTFTALSTAPLPLLKSLYLQFGTYKPTPEVLANFCKQFPKIEDFKAYVNFERNLFVNLAHLRGLVSSCPNLRFIDLREWGVRKSVVERPKAEVELCTELQKLQRLEFVNLAFSEFSNTFLPKLGKAVPKLRLLNLSASSCEAFKTGLEALFASCPLEYIGTTGTALRSKRVRKEMGIFGTNHRIEKDRSDFSPYTLQRCGFSQFVWM